MYAGFRERVYQRRPDVFAKDSWRAQLVLIDEFFGAFDDVVPGFAQRQPGLSGKNDRLAVPPSSPIEIAEHLSVFRLVIQDTREGFA